MADDGMPLAAGAGTPGSDIQLIATKKLGKLMSIHRNNCDGGKLLVSFLRWALATKAASCGQLVADLGSVQECNIALEQK
jgi:hypothetical protein